MAGHGGQHLVDKGGHMKGLILAIELAERQRDERAKALAQAQRNLIFGRQQMSQLQSYASDTDARWSGAGAVALSAELLRHHYQFMARLQQAIGMQEGAISNLLHQENAAKHALLQAESRVTGLQQVLRKRQAQAALLAQRREQARMDEMAALLYARTRKSPAFGDKHDH
jgi:flagellar FliJ protein